MKVYPYAGLKKYSDVKNEMTFKSIIFLILWQGQNQLPKRYS